ncbi:MAG: hypothetical protein ACJ76V_07735 [Thermoleophilaceae bacterium]
MRTAVNFGILALVALLIVLIPGGGSAVGLLLTLMSIGFFVVMAFFGVRMWRENRFALNTLSDFERGVLYGAIGLAFLTFTATPRLFNAGAAGALAWIALLALASYGVFWVWTRYRAYG